jgi:integrase
VKERCGPGAANDVYAALRRLFNWCVEREIVAASPLTGLRAPADAKSRERTLSDKELAAVWEAAVKLGYPFGPFIQILILTAQRRTEVARMRWQQIDLDAGTWTLDGEDTKAKRKHVVPLSSQALEILRSLPEGDGPGFVFTKTGATPISGFSKAKKRLDALSGVTDWELHDLRRTATTGLISLGVSEFLASRILNHAPKTLLGVTAVYNRYGYLPEMRRALEAWAAHVTGAEEGEPAKVVQLR